MTTPDPEENRAIAAGWTYFGQFVDHDITFDDRPNDLTSPIDVATLTSKRTKELDLDSLYGSGPVLSSALYASDGVHLLEGALVSGGTVGFRDLPRAANGLANVADPRNDENRMVAGIHASFLALHNGFVDALKKQTPTLSSAEVFSRARRLTTLQYQRVVLGEYLPEILDPATLQSVVSRTPSGGYATHLKLYSSCMAMPVEFSGAAYRFGHSMVRSAYRQNKTSPNLAVFESDMSKEMLVGFSPLREGRAIDWDLFLPSPTANKDLIQWSYKTDASLTGALGLLPLPVSSEGPASLSLRNLLRSTQLGLPSGQDVARALGITPLSDDRILVGPATPGASKPITSVSSSFKDSTPLWTYVLAESVAESKSPRPGASPDRMRLGPVGSRIIAETFVGLLASDPSSIINQTENLPLPRRLHEVLGKSQKPLLPPSPRVTPPTPPRTPAPRPTTTAPPRRAVAATSARAVKSPAKPSVKAVSRPGAKSTASARGASRSSSKSVAKAGSVTSTKGASAAGRQVP